MKVKFIPQNIELDINPGQSILDLAQNNDIHIQSVCKGIPSCAECRVYVKEGEHNVMPPQPKELELIGTAYFVDQRRLSCQLRCFGDVTIDLTEQNEKQNKSTKNPQGRYVKEREDSHARMGNVLEELTEEEKAYEAELLKAEPNNDSSVSSQKSKTKLDTKSFYNVDIESDKNNNRNSQNRNHLNNNQHNKNNSNRPHQGPQGKNAQGQNRGQQNSQSKNNNQRENHQGDLNQTQNVGAGNNPSGTSKSKRNRNRRKNKNRNSNSQNNVTSHQPSATDQNKKS